ncbi:ATP-binding cassette domain-containing protein [Clostridium sp. MCC353]|uniref:ABC transporter ATP-binding protein n=1 Tax=Clostridium sp. MCC353 TaxID=2592646 RepID=UPI001C01F73E|nr:ABC transporter ATP-binding protein [Clostridium sp. MCC353]MBT9776293.1 ATP-binding cassette domain-containing protein [Clostridium sp. MCC353]
MKRYKKYAKPYLSAFILGPLLMLTEVFGEIMLPKLMSLIINNGVAERNSGYIISVGMVMVLATVVMAAGGIGGAYFSAKASICFTSDLRNDIFTKVQGFSFQNIDKFSTGSLVTRLTNDIQQVQNVLMMGLRMMLRAPGMLVGALIMAFLMNAKLAAVILVVIPLLTAAIAVILKTAFPRFEIMQKKIDRLNSGIQEMLTNVRVIKSFVREDYEEEKFKNTNEELKQSSLNAMKIVIATMPVMMLAMNVTTLAVVWYGGNIIIAGDMKVGDLTAFTTYIVQILMSLMMLSMVFLQSSRAMASIKRVNEVMDTEVDLTDEHASRKDALVERGRVEFKDVSFRYGSQDEGMVLEHISFIAEPGQTIGIIGATGSGKTSLVQMIPRLYDATEGQVLVDGIDVRDYSLKNLREGVGMVLQKNVLFSGTIEENLRWGDENATFEQVRETADSAQADGFVTSFPDGYRTEMGQGGVNVSGGQKQRLCIARALLKRPKILILDDSTSAVDTATEAKIRECFQTTLKDTTKFIIAQRIGSVEGADQIIVIDDGRIIGIGNHSQLMAGCEAYQEIYYSQRDRESEATA